MGDLLEQVKPAKRPGGSGIPLPISRRLRAENSGLFSKQGTRAQAGVRSRLRELPIEDAAALAHDARNLLSALNLYCDLLAEPGVLNPRYLHYAGDLKRVGETGARLLTTLLGKSLREDSRIDSHVDPRVNRAKSASRRGSWRTDFKSADCKKAEIYGDRTVEREIAALDERLHGIDDLGAEVVAMAGLLQALSGPGLPVEVECAPCAGALTLTSEALLRILFNLVANAAEAMRGPGWSGSRTCALRVTAERGDGASFLAGAEAIADTVVLTVRDQGPGIAAQDLPRIFEPGFSSRSTSLEEPARGLGLAIVRQLVEAAGGRVRVVSAPGAGTRFDIELPLIGTGLSTDGIVAARKPEEPDRHGDSMDWREPVGSS